MNKVLKSVYDLRLLKPFQLCSSRLLLLLYKICSSFFFLNILELRSAENLQFTTNKLQIDCNFFSVLNLLNQIKLHKIMIFRGKNNI